MVNLTRIYTRTGDDGTTGLADGTRMPKYAPRIEAIGAVLYGRYLFLFESAGVVLLVAMIGTILLTHRKRTGVRKQIIADQVSRSRDNVELKKVQSGRGI